MTLPGAPPGHPAGHPPGDPARKGLSIPAKVALFVGVPLVVLVLIAVTAVAAVSLLRGSRYTEGFAAEAGSRVAVDVPNAAMDFRPSDDDLVHVTVEGSYFGAKPRFRVNTTSGVTTITGDCRQQWFDRCSITVSVALPGDLPLSVEGRNGRLAATRLSGPLDLSTTNGGIDARAVSGPLDLRTTNGGIQANDIRSRAVAAETTNGNVDLTFTRAPETVDARSTNGPVAVRVPEGDDYFVQASTTNGNINTQAVPSERRADREITARTTNGNVTIERSQG